VVKETYAATTRVPAGTETMLHVVTEFEHEGAGRTESWQAPGRFRRVGYHTDGTIHAEETLRRLPSGGHEYRAFHRERGGDIIRVARTTDPDAYDIDVIESDDDLHAAVKRGELRFVGETVFRGSRRTSFYASSTTPAASSSRTLGSSLSAIPTAPWRSGSGPACFSI
jgi:hypothetical protein